MTNKTNPTFPDAITQQDLPVDSYLRLSDEDVAKVYQHVHDDLGLSKLVIHLENLHEIFDYVKRYKPTDYILDLWDYCTSDFHYMPHWDKGTPLPKYGDYSFFVIVHRCFDMAPVAREIAKLITGVDDWQIVENLNHAAVYSPSKRMLYDIMADSQGEEAFHYPEANKFDKIEISA